MEEWEDPPSLGPIEAKENASSPIGTVCSLKYMYCFSSLESEMAQDVQQIQYLRVDL